MDSTQILEQAENDVNKLKEMFDNNEINAEQYSNALNQLIDEKISNFDSNNLIIPNEILATLNKKQLKNLNKKGLIDQVTYNNFAGGGSGAKKGLIIGGIIAAVVVVITIIIVLFSTLFGGKDLNLEDYVEVSASGYDGYGIAVLTDKEGNVLEADYEGTFNESIYNLVKKDLDADERSDYQNLIYSMDIEFEPAIEISNGDEVKVIFSGYEEKADIYGIDVNGSEISTKVEELGDIADLYEENDKKAESAAEDSESVLRSSFLGNQVISGKDEYDDTPIIFVMSDYILIDYYGGTEYATYVTAYDTRMEETYNSYVDGKCTLYSDSLNTSSIYGDYSGECEDYYAVYDEDLTEINPDDGVSQDLIDELSAVAKVDVDDSNYNDATVKFQGAYNNDGTIVIAYTREYKLGSTNMVYTYFYEFENIIEAPDGQYYYDADTYGNMSFEDSYAEAVKDEYGTLDKVTIK